MLCSPDKARIVLLVRSNRIAILANGFSILNVANIEEAAINNCAIKEDK